MPRPTGQLKELRQYIEDLEVAWRCVWMPWVPA